MFIITDFYTALSKFLALYRVSQVEIDPHSPCPKQEMCIGLAFGKNQPRLQAVEISSHSVLASPSPPHDFMNHANFETVHTLLPLIPALPTPSRPSSP